MTVFEETVVCPLVGRRDKPNLSPTHCTFDDTRYSPGMRGARDSTWETFSLGFSITKLLEEVDTRLPSVALTHVSMMVSCSRDCVNSMSYTSSIVSPMQTVVDCANVSDRTFTTENGMRTFTSVTTLIRASSARNPTPIFNGRVVISHPPLRSMPV